MAKHSKQEVLQVSHGEQKSLFRWRLLAAIALEYPERVNALKPAVLAYREADQEARLLLERKENGLIEVREFHRIKSLYHWAGVHDDIEIGEYSPSMQKLLVKLDEWAYGLSKKKFVNARRIVFWLQQIMLESLREIDDDKPIAPQLEDYCREIIKYRAVTGRPMTKVTGRPEPITANPRHQTEAEFIELCRLYYRKTKEFLAGEAILGDVLIDEIQKVNELHFHWLAWQTVDGLSLRKIADKNAERGWELVTYRAVDKALKPISALIF